MFEKNWVNKDNKNNICMPLAFVFTDIRSLIQKSEHLECTNHKKERGKEFYVAGYVSDIYDIVIPSLESVNATNPTLFRPTEV